MTIFTDGLRQSAGVGVDEVGASLGESLSASAGEAVEHMPTVSLAHIGELSAAQGQVPDFGGPIPPELSDLFTTQPETPIADARKQVKDSGLDVHLPDAPTIKTPALQIMLDRARAERERQATISRGPSGFFPGALSVGTSFLVSAVDPLNVAAAFIPVMGEARYSKLLADAGTSFAPRLAVRAGVGAGQGAVGMAAIEPIEGLARTQEGRDYTYADALRSVMFGTVLGAGLHGGGGAVGDMLRGRRGEPVYPFARGEPAFDPEKDLFKPTARADALGERPAIAAGDDRIRETFLNPAAAVAKDEKQQSLLQFLAARGGIRNDDALIGDVKSAIGKDNHFVAGVGNLIQEPRELSTAAERGGAGAPMTLDQAREAAVEAGYLVDHGREGGRTGTTTISTLLDAMDGELRGAKLYPKGEQHFSAAELERHSEEEAFHTEGARAELDKALGDSGFRPGDIDEPTRARAVDLMVKEGHEPLDAYERATLEARPISPVVAALDDLPPGDKENALRVSIGALHDGEPVRAGDMLGAAAKADPRIAESLGEHSGPAERGGPDAAWHDLAGTSREFDDPDSLAASHAAQNLPDPASVSSEPNKRVQAAEAAAAQAEAEYKAAEPYLPEDLKAKVERDLAALDADLADRTEVIRRGAACLASVAAGAA